MSRSTNCLIRLSISFSLRFLSSRHSYLSWEFSFFYYGWAIFETESLLSPFFTALRLTLSLRSSLPHALQIYHPTLSSVTGPCSFIFPTFSCQYLWHKLASIAAPSAHRASRLRSNKLSRHAKNCYPYRAVNKFELIEEDLKRDLQEQNPFAQQRGPEFSIFLSEWKEKVLEICFVNIAIPDAIL